MNHKKRFHWSKFSIKVFPTTRNVNNWFPINFTFQTTLQVVFLSVSNSFFQAVLYIGCRQNKSPQFGLRFKWVEQIKTLPLQCPFVNLQQPQWTLWTLTDWLESSHQRPIRDHPWHNDFWSLLAASQTPPSSTPWTQKLLIKWVCCCFGQKLIILIWCGSDVRKKNYSVLTLLKIIEMNTELVSLLSLTPGSSTTRDVITHGWGFLFLLVFYCQTVLWWCRPKGAQRLDLTPWWD